MAFTTKDSFTFNHTGQTPYPAWTHTQSQTNLDARGEELRLALNVVVNLLNSSAAAASIGTVPPSGFAGITIKAVLDELKDAIDDVVAGSTADGSLEDVKLSNTATEIKARFAAHLVDMVSHITGAERTTWNAKLAAASYTAADVLSKIITVDGVGSSLDADLLDGYQSGNSAGQIPISNGVENVTLNAALLNGVPANQIIPAGQVSYFAMTSAPTNWLKCDGAAVSRATYATLFSAIGTTWGVGNGSTTFNLPDLRGEFVRGFDDGKGTDTGRVFASSQTEMVGKHNHAFNTIISGTGYNQVSNGVQGALSASATSNNTGTETRPRNIALLACIKY